MTSSSVVVITFSPIIVRVAISLESSVAVSICMVLMVVSMKRVVIVANVFIVPVLLEVDVPDVKIHLAPLLLILLLFVYHTAATWLISHIE